MDDHDLLCDEDWLSSSPSHSPSTPDHHEQKPKIHKQGLGFETSCKQECDEAYVMYRQKELCYFPEQGYVDCVLSDNGLMLFRSKAIQWFVKSRIRLNLSFMSVFNAVNYLDRFVSLNHCQGWRYCMFELLSVACLSVASKFAETSGPSLVQIQMEDLEYSFEANTIKRMELTLLQALGWKLDCVTTYSYVELLISNLDSTDSHFLDELRTGLTQVLLGCVLDVLLLKYRPSVVAISALQCTVERLMLSSRFELAHITKHDVKKDDLDRCRMIMKSRVEDPWCEMRVNGQSKQSKHWPSSPVTVLLKERIEIYDCKVDFSIFEKNGTVHDLDGSRRKRRKM